MAQSNGQAERRRSRRSSVASGQTLRAPEDPKRAPKLGDVIGEKYRIDGLLGQGGMGAVYRAVHAVSGKRVAVKWMLPAGGSEDIADRFVREARATARIDHPNVVDIYDVGTHEGSVYLVMELLHGESLAERLERGAMEPVEAVSLLMHALRAVAAAHSQGVIHRDLKPDNIFLCEGPDGEPREPKVLDFGISKIAAGQDMRDMSLTQSGTVMGTPYYMSPEQVRGLRDVDERGDVYACGVILYEMLTSAFPFDAETYNDLILKIVTEEPTPILTLRPELDPILASVIARAMARDREQRYRSIAALAADLEPFSGGVPFRRQTTAPGMPILSQAVPRGTTERTEASRAEATAAARPNARSRRPLWIAAAVLVILGFAVGLWLRPAKQADVSASASQVPTSRTAPQPTLAPANTGAPANAAPTTRVEASNAVTNNPSPAVTRQAPAEAGEHTTSEGAEAAAKPERLERKDATRKSARARTDTARDAPSAGGARPLPTDWDERLPTGKAQAPGSGASNRAGTLGRDDL